MAEAGDWLLAEAGDWHLAEAGERRVLVSGIDLDQYVRDTRRKKKKTQHIYIYIIYAVRVFIMINLTPS